MLGDIVRYPDLLAAIGALIAIALSLFCAALFIINLRNVYRGQTTLETYGTPKPHYPSPPLVWVPGELSALAGTSSGVTVSRLPSEHPYDLGWRENMRALIKRLKSGMNDKYYDIPRLNPEMLRRMQESAASGRREVSPPTTDNPIEPK
ncbi:hypothetical protein FS837_006179 [Tulasnella sp. UAMH 9824]|nr:hypothetical protein FS837_006179 [Tulasnella sp. UAMH 9824]